MFKSFEWSYHTDRHQYYNDFSTRNDLYADISVLGVYEGIQEQDIIDYAKSHSPLKIAVTYDSLPRTIRALESAGFNPYKDLFLLVDE